MTLDTFKAGTSHPSNSFVGIATGAQNGLLTFAGTASVPGLRKGSHVAGVSVSAGTVAVKRVLSRAVKLPPSLRLAFTAANGAKTDDHVITAAKITAAGTRYRVRAAGGPTTGPRARRARTRSSRPMRPTRPARSSTRSRFWQQA